jgi:nucleotide-binding universal stress UspA family protein
MAEIEDSTLLDIALGLRSDPELRATVDASPQLRQRLRQLENELRGLDGELCRLKPQVDPAHRTLPVGPWRILLAIDDSQPSGRAVAAAGQLAQLASGEVVVLHVREAGPTRGCALLETRTEAERLVEKVITWLSGKGIEAEGELCSTRFGAAARAIADVACRIEADGPSDLAALLGSGSVSHEVIRRASCPVLVVR